MKSDEIPSSWTFFSNYGHTVILLAQQPDLTMREIAQRIGVTERAVIRIINDLVHEGYLHVSKRGRRNFYRINQKAKFRHPIESNKSISQILSIFVPRG